MTSEMIELDAAEIHILARFFKQRENVGAQVPGGTNAALKKMAHRNQSSISETIRPILVRCLLQEGFTIEMPPS